MLPTFEIVQGLYRDILLEGPGVATLDFSTFDSVKVKSSSLGLLKEDDDPTELQIVNAGADLQLHLIPADTDTKQVGSYPYRVTGITGGKEFDLFGIGFLVIKRAP